MSSAQKTVLTNTAIITVLIFSSKCLGFLRESIIASTFGAGFQTDAFYMSFGITGLLTAAFSSLFSVVFLPMYSEIKHNTGRKAADEYASNIINIIVMLTITVTAIGVVFAPQIMQLVAPGFSGEKLELTVKITRILLGFGVFIVTVGYFSALLNANEKFIVPQLMGLPMTLLGIAACLFFAQRWGIISLAWAIGLSHFLQPIILLVSLRKVYTHHAVLRIKDDKLKKTVILGLPALATALVANVNTMVDKTLSSTLAEGSVASLRYADTLISFAAALFVMPISIVLFTKLSEQSARDDKEGIVATLNRGVLFIITVLIPITAITMLDAKDIVRTAYARGQFDISAVTNTSIALRFYALQFVFLGLSNLLSRTLIAVKDTKSLMVAGISGMALDIVLNFVFIRIWGIAGLALSTSIAAAFTSVLQFIAVRKKLGPLGILKLLKQLIKIIAATIICAAVTWMLIKFMPIKRPVFRFSLCAALGLGSYALTLLAVKAEAAVEGFELIKIRLKQLLNKKINQ